METEQPKKVQKYRRLRFWINPRVQGAIIAYVLGLTLISGGILYIGVSRTLEAVEAETIRINPSYSQAVMLMRDIRMGAIKWFFVTHGSVALLLMAIGSVLLTHRVVGPVYRLKMIIKQLLDGKEPVTTEFRKHDFLGDVFPLIQELAQRYRKYDKK